MKQKEGVILAGLQIEMRPVLVQAKDVWLRLGQELVVTSGLEGEHSAGSLHYYGYAVDLRTRYFTDVEKREAYDYLVARLGVTYDVIWKPTHIHVEYDPK